MRPKNAQALLLFCVSSLTAIHLSAPIAKADEAGTLRYRMGSLSAELNCPGPGETAGTSSVTNGDPVGCIGTATANTFLILFNDGYSEHGELDGSGVSGCMYGQRPTDPTHGGIATVLGCTYQARQRGESIAAQETAPASTAK